MIESGYNQQGGNQTFTRTPSLPQFSAPVPSFGGGGLPFDPTEAMRRKLAEEAEQRKFENSLKERALRMQEMQAKQQMSFADQDRARAMNPGGEGRRAPDPLAALKAQDRYEATQRSAATRPVGLGAQMIPGMAVDVNKLPSRMRPQSSQFQGGNEPSRASLTPGPALGPAPTSNRGFDYADPYSQAQIQRASFGR
jgi:hypothetical protein